MLPYLTESFGNPSSAHGFGRAARAGLDEAHERVAARLHAGGREIVFTSGGTEANNLALKGAAWAGKARGHRIVTSSVEHHAVGHTLRYLEKFGFEIVELPVDRYGRVDPDQLEAALNDRTILVSIMLANNEVGTIQPIAEIVAPRPDAQGHPVPRRRGPGGAVPRPRCRGARRRPRLARRAQVRGARRASARCTSATGRTSWPSSRAAPRSATGGPARRTSPAPSASPPPTSCPARAARDGRPAARAARPALGGGPGRPRRRADRPSQGPACRGSSRSSPATPTGRRSRWRSISRASPARSARPARPARPRSATS